jgi:hypothetical protein
MVNLQEVFDRIQVAKKEQKEIRTLYRDALANSVEYQKVSEDYEKIKQKKKEIVDNVKVDFRPEFDRIEELKIAITDDSLMMSDIALTSYLKGEPLEITDQNQSQYEPIFSVKFKKTQ